MSTFRLLSLAAVLTGTAAAQRVWTVDAMNRPGTDFKDLPPAIAAAGADDIVLLRAGAKTPYTATDIQGPIRIVGEPGVTVWGGVHVSKVSSGMVTFRRVLLLGTGTRPGLDITDNQSRVHLEEVTMRGAARMPGLRAQRIAHMSLHDCVAHGVVLQDATVTWSGGAVTAIDASCQDKTPQRSEPGLRITNGDVHLEGLQVTGGNGCAYYSTTLPPSPAGVITSTQLRARGATVFAAGGLTSDASPGLQGDSRSSLELGTTVSLRANGNAPGHRGFGSSLVEPLPALDVYGSKLGGWTDSTVRSRPGDVFALFLGAPARRSLRLGAIGTLWIDPALLVQVGGGLIGANGESVVTLPRSKDLQFRGFAVAYQALTLSRTRLRLTNLVTLVHF